jgi:hypothetical protein
VGEPKTPKPHLYENNINLIFLLKDK